MVGKSCQCVFTFYHALKSIIIHVHIGVGFSLSWLDHNISIDEHTEMLSTVIYYWWKSELNFFGLSMADS